MIDQELRHPDQLTTALLEIMERMGNIAVAVSGGVDSMTLATVAHRGLGVRSSMYHAVSPAVPEEATRRVRDLAAAEGWKLRIVDAREFAEPQYVSNPVNRCYFCKTSLYGTIARVTSDQIVSGANLDDLNDYRPGLDAAREHGVRHPFVDAGVSKSQIRMLARELGLPEVAALPAAPCLSSRVETGIAIQTDVLQAIHLAEKVVAANTSADTVRCRVRASGIIVELDAKSLADMTEALERKLRTEVIDIFKFTDVPAGMSFAAYRMGGAFLRGAIERA